MRHRICAFPQRGWQQKQGHPRHGRRTIPAHGSTFVRQYNHSAGRCAAHPHKITFGNPRLHGHHHLCCTGSPACRPVNYFGWMRMQLLPPPTEISPAPQGLWWTRRSSWSLTHSLAPLSLSLSLTRPQLHPTASTAWRELSCLPWALRSAAVPHARNREEPPLGYGACVRAFLVCTVWPQEKKHMLILL
jgi:hypothetical protein